MESPVNHKNQHVCVCVLCVCVVCVCVCVCVCVWCVCVCVCVYFFLPSIQYVYLKNAHFVKSQHLAHLLLVLQWDE